MVVFSTLATLAIVVRISPALKAIVLTFDAFISIATHIDCVNYFVISALETDRFAL